MKHALSALVCLFTTAPACVHEELQAPDPAAAPSSAAADPPPHLDPRAQRTSPASTPPVPAADVPCPTGTTWDGRDCAVASAPASDPSAPVAARFARTQGTIIDTATSLMWQRSHPVTKVKWAEAVRYCTSLALAGGGWRLPTAKELAAIAGQEPFAAQEAGADQGFFWSATSSDVDDARAAIVRTADGASRLYFKDLDASVRCVRGGST